MHERERHRIILSAVQERAVVTVQDAMEYTGASEATIRRDIAALADEGRLRKVRGGTTTFQMVHYLTGRRLQVLTNSFPISEHLLKHSRCTVIVPAGTIYREQSIILSPVENDGTVHFYA